MAKAAALIGTGVTINQLRTAYKMLPESGDGSTLPLDAPVAVKEAVLPFSRFRTLEGKVVDSLLGPEMRSTGEVMGIDKHFDTAFAKSQAAANNALPTEGKVFVSVANRDKRAVIMAVKRLSDLGFEIVSTGGTADVLRRNGLQATTVRKVAEGSSAEGEGTIADLIIAGEIDMVFNTPSGGEARGDGYEIRAAATSIGIPCDHDGGRVQRRRPGHRGDADLRVVRHEPAGARRGPHGVAELGHPGTGRAGSQSACLRPAPPPSGRPGVLWLPARPGHGGARPALRRHRPAPGAAAALGPERRRRRAGALLADSARGRGSLAAAVKPQVALYERHGFARDGRAGTSPRGSADAGCSASPTPSAATSAPPWPRTRTRGCGTARPWPRTR